VQAPPKRASPAYTPPPLPAPPTVATPADVVSLRVAEWKRKKDQEKIGFHDPRFYSDNAPSDAPPAALAKTPVVTPVDAPVAASEFQQLLMEVSRLRTSNERLEVLFKSFQNRSDEQARTLTDTLRKERHSEWQAFEAKLKSALKMLSDQTYFLFAVSLRDVPLHVEPSLSSENVGTVQSDSHMCLVYPMQTDDNRNQWIRVRSVEGNGQITTAWAPIQVNDGEDIFIGNFTV